MSSQHNEQKQQFSSEVFNIIVGYVSDDIGISTTTSNPKEHEADEKNSDASVIALQKANLIKKLKSFGPNPKLLIQAWRDNQKQPVAYEEQDKLKEMESAYEWHNKRLKDVLEPPPFRHTTTSDEIITLLVAHPDYHPKIIYKSQYIHNNEDKYTRELQRINEIERALKLKEETSDLEANEPIEPIGSTILKALKDAAEKNERTPEEELAQLKERLIYQALTDKNFPPERLIGEGILAKNEFLNAMKRLSDYEFADAFSTMRRLDAILHDKIEPAVSLEEAKEVIEEDAKAVEVDASSEVAEIETLERLLDLNDLDFVSVLSHKRFSNLYDKMTPEFQKRFDDRVKNLNSNSAIKLFFNLANNQIQSDSWSDKTLQELKKDLPDSLQEIDFDIPNNCPTPNAIFEAHFPALIAGIQGRSNWSEELHDLIQCFELDGRKSLVEYLCRDKKLFSEFIPTLRELNQLVEIVKATPSFDQKSTLISQIINSFIDNSYISFIDKLIVRWTLLINKVQRVLAPSPPAVEQGTPQIADIEIPDYLVGEEKYDDSDSADNHSTITAYATISRQLFEQTQVSATSLLATRVAADLPVEKAPTLRENLKTIPLDDPNAYLALQADFEEARNAQNEAENCLVKAQQNPSKDIDQLVAAQTKLREADQRCNEIEAALRKARPAYDKKMKENEAQNKVFAADVQRRWAIDQFPSDLQEAVASMQAAQDGLHELLETKSADESSGQVQSIALATVAKAVDSAENCLKTAKRTKSPDNIQKATDLLNTVIELHGEVKQAHSQIQLRQNLALLAEKLNQAPLASLGLCNTLDGFMNIDNPKVLEWLKDIESMTHSALSDSRPTTTKEQDIALLAIRSNIGYLIAGVEEYQSLDNEKQAGQQWVESSSTMFKTPSLQNIASPLVSMPLQQQSTTSAGLS
ncbi:MAG: hypothetical protein K0Q74_1624 [Gammaproteobacteria bacterium]|nr:hypothetical protein [Gammaproteobacteria bacterium]